MRKEKLKNDFFYLNLFTEMFVIYAAASYKDSPLLSVINLIESYLPFA